jgi:hypothetical protein
MKFWQQIRDETLDTVVSGLVEIGGNIFGELIGSLIGGIFDGL